MTIRITRLGPMFVMSLPTLLHTHTFQNIPIVPGLLIELVAGVAVLPDYGVF